MLSPLGNKISQTLFVSHKKTFLFAKKISLRMNKMKGKYLNYFYAFAISIAIYEQMDLLDEYLRCQNLSKFSIEKLSFLNRENH